MPRFSIRSSLGSIKHRCMRSRGPPDPRSIPERVRAPIYIRKKCTIWARWRPVPVKNVNYPRASSSRRSGLVGPHTTPPIVNYKYMTSTPREGHFGAAHARDVNILIWTSRKSVDHGTNDRVKVHGNGTRADGRRSSHRAHLHKIVGGASWPRRAEHLGVSEQCSRQSGRLAGPSHK